VLTGTPVGTALTTHGIAPKVTSTSVRFCPHKPKTTQLPTSRRRRGGHRGHRRRRHQPRNPTQQGGLRMNAQSNGAPSLPDFVPVIIVGAGPAGITAATLLPSTASSAWCWTAMKPPTAAARGARRRRDLPHPGPPGHQATSSPPTPGPRWVFGCSTPTCGCWPRSSAAPNPAPTASRR